MNTVLYIRVSTQEQADEGFSIDAQKDRLINFCKAKEWNATNIYIDPGFSGSNLNRPAMQQMIADAKGKKFDTVLVYKLDRISRSQKDTLYLIEDVFIKNGIGFVSMQESFDTSTAFGRAMIGILSVFAQLERENIKERSKMGKSERARQGLWKGGNLPLGYDYVDGKLIPNANAPIIKKIYDMYIAGAGSPTIAKETGYKQGTSIFCILRSPIYAGKISNGGEIYDGTHEAIIPYETFLQVQKLTKIRSCKRGKEAKGPFAGLIFCKRCGAGYFRHIGSMPKYKHYYYSCYSRFYKNSPTHVHMVKDRDCLNTHWRSESFEEALFSEIKKVTCDEKRLASLLEPKPEKKADAKNIEKDIKVIDQKISRLMDLYLDKNMPTEVLKVKIDELGAKKTALTNIIETEKNIIDETGWLKERFRSVSETLDSIDIPAQRNLLSTVIKAILIDGDTIEIEWRV